MRDLQNNSEQHPALSPHGVPRILIVDDSPETRYIYKRFMSRSKHDYWVAEAETVEDGLRQLREEKFDCVLLDFCLPDADGLDLLTEVAAGSRECPIPVVMITGEGNERVAVEAMKLGAKDYLVKASINAENLVEAIENALEKARADRDDSQYIQKLELQSVTDPLTGLHNRRYLFDQLGVELHRGSRYKTPVCLLMIDVDHFKNVNDTYGHTIGDEILKSFAGLLTHIARNTDIIVRYGGEEFCVVLTNTGLDGGCNVAERICKETRSMTHKDNDGNEFKVTCSIGVVASSIGRKTLEQIIQMSDEALYEAKHRGRDQAVVYQAAEKATA